MQAVTLRKPHDGFLHRLTFAGDVGALEESLDAEMLGALRAFRRDPREKPLVTFVGAGNSGETNAVLSLGKQRSVMTRP